MRSGRPRPTYIDMPPEGQVEREDVELLESAPGERAVCDDALIEEVANDILNAGSAVIFAGGGVARSGAFDELIEFDGVDRDTGSQFGGWQGCYPILTSEQHRFVGRCGGYDQGHDRQCRCNRCHWNTFHAA